MSVSRLLGPPVQIAYVVPDAVAAATRWANDFGAGPFFVRPHIEVVDVVHRGRPSTFDHTSAYGQWGSIMVELVEDHQDDHTAVRDMFAPGQSGLHHFAFFVDDPAATTSELGKLGYELSMSAKTVGGVEFCFIDAVADLGHMFELYPPIERLTSFYASVADAADGWNGADPVRML